MVLDHKFALTVGSTLYSARTLKIKEEEGFRWVHLFYQSNCTHYLIPNIVLNTLNAGLWAHCFLCLIWAAFASCICHIFPDACYSDVLICFRTYYFYEFGREGQHAALVAAVSSGRVSYYTLKTLITCQELWHYNLIFSQEFVTSKYIAILDSKWIFIKYPVLKQPRHISKPHLWTWILECDNSILWLCHVCFINLWRHNITLVPYFCCRHILLEQLLQSPSGMRTAWSFAPLLYLWLFYSVF